MKQYEVIPLTIGGRFNRIFKCGDIVKETDFPPNAAEAMVQKGHLRKVGPPVKQVSTMNVTVGVVVPTRGDRPLFVERAKLMISRQTFAPDHLCILDQDSGMEGVDLAWRYRTGFADLFEKGCDVAICWEDDDWYANDFIETMVNQWFIAGKPEVFGIGESIYYNIFSNKYAVFNHHGRASMMATLVTNAVLRLKWDLSDAYLDAFLWKSLRGKTFLPQKPIAIGIKHGMGLCGGGGHTHDWARYTQHDPGFQKLCEFTGPDSVFYKAVARIDNYEITNRQYGNSRPVVTILTRMHGNRRPQGFALNQASIKKLKGSFEQIFIKDKAGLGMFAANSSFQLAVPHIRGQWVYLLDDDDYMVDPDIIQKIKKSKADVVVVRALIKSTVYPPNALWEKRPKRAGIGGGCVFVRREHFIKYISHFTHERMGDFEFIDCLFSANLKVEWMDRLVVKTFKVSHGKTE